MKEKIKDISLITISLIIIVWSKWVQIPFFRSVGYLLGQLTIILPVRVIEGLVISWMIWGFTKEESKKWFSFFSLGFFVIACLDLVLFLF